MENNHILLVALIMIGMFVVFYFIFPQQEGFCSHCGRVPCSYETQKSYGGVSYRGRNVYKEECPYCHSCVEINQHI